MSFNPYNHVQVEDLPITFNPVEHAEDVLSYFNSLNAVPMENPLAFNPYSHVEAVDSSICFNSATHSQMWGHTSFSNSSDLVQPGPAQTFNRQGLDFSAQSMRAC